MENQFNAKTNIVIVSWNALDYTMVTINSLFKTVHCNYYLTIVDNASTDETVEYLKNIKKPENCLELNLILNSQNYGYGKAINQGYDVSKKYNLKYTCVCNNDLFFQEDWLEKMESCLEENNNIAILGAMRPALDIFDFRTKRSLKEIVDSTPDSYTPEEEIREITQSLSFEDFCEKIIINNENNIKILNCPPETVVTCCALIRNEAVAKLGCLADPQFEIYGGEDIDLSWSLFKIGYDVAILNKVYVHHFRHKSSKSSGLDRNKFLTENNLKFYKKWKNELFYFLKNEKNKIGNLDDLFTKEDNYEYFFLRRINDKTNLYRDFTTIENDLFINEVSIEKPIGNLYRKNHILILVRDKNGNFILGQKKNFYADGVSRMLGGGLKDGEDPREAARRELAEETGLDMNSDVFFSLGQVITKANTSEGIMHMNVRLYGLSLETDATIIPGDDISGVQIYSQRDLEKLIEDMGNLEGEFRNEKFYFLHRDWGKIYKFIHNIALNNFLKNENTLSP